MHVTNIKRDPKCDQNASWSEKLKFYERVRITGKELSEENEWSNAKILYSRCLSLFKNISKAQRESFNEQELRKRDEILNLLNLNLALCLLKKNMPNDAIKCAQEALLSKKVNPKAHYRMYLAY